MLLSARPLKDCVSVNSWELADSISWTAGDKLTICFRIVDLNLDADDDTLFPFPGRRYCPVAGATLQCVIENLDGSRAVTRYATQPFEGDTSIWALAINASDACRGSPQLRLTLVEDVGAPGPADLRTTRGLVKAALKIHPRTNI